MSDSFDSGDELFDDVDVDELLAAGSQPPTSSAAAAGKRKRVESDVNSRQQEPLKRQRGQNANNTIGLDDEEPIVIDPDDFSDDDAAELNPADNSARMDVAQKLLTDTFGYDSFRHEQAGAIGRTLAGSNALTVFPTGAGKSLCYQVCFPSSHLFSPLVQSPD